MQPYASAANRASSWPMFRRSSGHRDGRCSPSATRDVLPSLIAGRRRRSAAVRRMARRPRPRAAGRAPRHRGARRRALVRARRSAARRLRIATYRFEPEDHTTMSAVAGAGSAAANSTTDDRRPSHRRRRRRLRDSPDISGPSSRSAATRRARTRAATRSSRRSARANRPTSCCSTSRCRAWTACRR